MLRVADQEADPRYLVVDYKTNWLGPLDGPTLTLADYTPARMAEAMTAAHYPLQALLYSVALHRLLRWRQPGYDPARHLGGVALPVRPGDGRAGDAAGRRSALRGVQLASAGRPGAGAVGPAGRAASQ